MFRMLRYFAGAVIAATLLAVPFYISRAGLSANTVSVIVELNGDPGSVYAAKMKKSGTPVSDAQLRAYRNQLTATQNQFLTALQASGVAAQLQSVAVKDPSGNVAGNVPLRYSLVYNGMTLTVPETAVPLIAKMNGVKAVHPNTALHPTLFKSVPYIRAPQLYGHNPNNMTPFATAPDGDEGQGQYIAVIDTGIDWTHPMFGGDPTPPRLGIGLNSASVPSNQKVVYSLPMSDIVTDGFGHGTHVASEAAGYLANAPGGDGIPGTGDDIPIHGVAPQAKLMSYKVCSDTLSTAAEAGAVVQDATGIGWPLGGCFSSVIVMGIEDAVSPQTVDLQPKPIANVINMSLGGGGGPDEPTAIASDNATLLGCAVVAAAGNSGPGEGTVGAPAAGRRVISPAANTDPGSGGDWSADLLDSSAVSATQTGAVTPANNLPTAAGTSRIHLFAMSGSTGLPDGSLAQRYVYVDNANSLNPTLPASVSGRIALINTILTGATFCDIALQAQNAGAIGVIIADDRGAVNGVKTLIPAATVSTADFAVLAAHVANTDGAISDLPVRMNPTLEPVFVGQVADFSSRGPVQGYGQIKPDVSAPGVNVLAAAPQASLVWALANSGPLYATISGTSMATPHTSGSVALIRTAHPEWSPDMIRTAMINAATNMRDANGTPKADGSSANSVLEQGGGLIDVYHAATLKALMGTIEDDGKGPFMLGSHSYGEVPVANNRVTSTQSVNVTIRDLSGQGGTYNLAVANNRDLQINGISVSTNPSSVSVPANGTATFTVNTTFDGNLIRDPNTAEVNGTSVTFRQIETQWYVTARRSDGGESLRMPFYYKPTFSLPVSTGAESSTSGGTIAVGDLDEEVQPGVDYVDIPVTVDATTSKIDAELDYFPLPAGNTTVVTRNIELDLYLLDPAGKRIARSTNGFGSQKVSAIVVNKPGTYTLRVDGNQCAGTSFTVTTIKTHGDMLPPAMQTIAGDFVNAQGAHVDFDGNVTVSWTPTGSEQAFEIEKSSDNQNWDFVADVPAGQASYSFSNLANGSYYFRVSGIKPGQIGKFVTLPSNVSSVLVDTRSQVDITSLVSYPVSNVSLTGGVWQQDVNLVNNTANSYVPFVDFNVVGITSASGTVRVINADNGFAGTSPSNAANFSFTNKLGADQIFSPAETTASRTIRFQDSASEMFSWDVQVTAFVASGGSSSASSQSSSAGGSGSSSSGGLPTGNLPLTKLTAVMRFTANPLTRTVTSKLISLK